jgi:hypothetical protein
MSQRCRLADEGVRFLEEGDDADAHDERRLEGSGA